ncbi:MAG: hypothetical protein JST83_09030 [Bacteroidetes bacterium]|nr:hypothetical protein [Bacteroidota bacterium]
MKKILIAVSIIAIAAAACSKTKGKDGGSWTFKGVNYKPTFVNYVLGAFTAYTQENLPTGSLAFTFSDSISYRTIDSIRAQYKRATNRDTTIPKPVGAPRLGTYMVTSTNPPDSGYVFVRMTDTAPKRTYVSFYRAGALVSASVSSDQKTTQVDVSGIYLFSDQHPTADSGTLDAHLTQINY